MVVGRIIVIDHLIAYLVGRNRYRSGRYKDEVDDLIGRAVVRKGCGIIELLIRDLVRILHSARNDRRECRSAFNTVKVTRQDDRIVGNRLEILDKNLSLQFACFRACMVKMCIDDHYSLTVGLLLKKRVGINSGQ